MQKLSRDKFTSDRAQITTDILRRWSKTPERLTCEDQTGFRSDRRCIGHIFTLR